MLAHGWLHKKGQIFPTIRKRYFILQQGQLSYYKQDVSALMPNDPIDGMKINDVDESPIVQLTEEQSKQLPKALGKFSVFDYHLYSDSSDGRIELLLMPGECKLLVVVCIGLFIYVMLSNYLLYD